MMKDWLLSGLLVAGLLLQVTAGVLSAQVEVQRPEHFSFALQGAVREVKSVCTDESCSSFVLLRAHSEQASGKKVGSSDTAGSPTLELWQLEFSSASGPAVQPQMKRLRAGIPRDAGRLAVCRDDAGGDGGGASEQDAFLVMFQAQGSVFFVDPSAGESPLGSGTRVGSDKWSAPARPWKPDCSEILMVGPGEARLLRLAGRGTRRSLLTSKLFPISLTIGRNGSGLKLESPEVRRVGQGESGLIVVGPKVYDSLRLETIVFPPTAASVDWLAQLGSDQDRAVVSTAEIGTDSSATIATSARRLWSRLPAAERILESDYLTVDGVLVLVVVTKEADKMGLLERKKLRLFRVTTDRTRLGKLPFFATLSASRLWQRLDVEFLDVSADGIKDLVLVQPEGLGGEPTVVDVYLATAPLQFASKKTRTVLQTGLVWWSLENDWDGDGLMDVVVLDGGILQFHLGRSSDALVGRRHKKKRGFWSTAPSFTMDLHGLGRAGDTEVTSDEDVEEDFMLSSLRKVWVDGGVMVIPTDSGSRQMVRAEGNVTITVNRSPSVKEGGAPEPRGTGSLIHVVRAPAKTMMDEPKN